MKTIAIAATMVLLGLTNLNADMVGGWAPTQALLNSELSGISVGGQVELIDRAMISGDSEVILEASAPSVFLTWDALPFLQLFGTLGQTEVAVAGSEKSDGEFGWSLGARTSLWSMNVDERHALRGSLSILAGVQYHDYSSSNDAVFELDSFSGNMVVRYERVDPEGWTFPMALYVGPSYSSAELSTPLLPGVTLSENQDMGIVGGIDIYFPGQVFFSYEVSAYTKAQHTLAVGVYF